MIDEYENVTEAELREFLENYPGKLDKRGTTICSPPLAWYVDVESDVTVAKEYEANDNKDDLWYMPENKRYYILRNYEEVIKQEIKRMKERKPPEIYANVVLKDGKLFFWKTGKFYPHLYSFFDDFRHAGLNYAQEMDWKDNLLREHGRYKVVNLEIDKMEDAKDFYRKYELHEDFKGEKPY